MNAIRNGLIILLLVPLALIPAVVTEAQMAAPASPAAPTGAVVGVAELTPRTEAAIDRGLAYLARLQAADGSIGSGDYVEALTALSIMAFMVKGDFPDREPYGQVLSKALDYLLRKSKAGGGYIGNSMYAHGLATLCLSEAWGMCERPEIRPALKAAVQIILKSQRVSGGWRYQPVAENGDQDISVTVVQIVALASAKEAGIAVPDKVIAKALAWVKTCQGPSGGFGYQPRGPPGLARTGAGLLSLMMCGERGTPAVKRGLDWLLNQPETKFQEVEFYSYAHYYAMQAMYQAGEGYYQAWYPKIRDALLASQAATGGWSRSYGAAFDTSTAILILGVPYRFLPIYQR